MTAPTHSHEIQGDGLLEAMQTGRPPHDQPERARPLPGRRNKRVTPILSRLSSCADAKISRGPKPSETPSFLSSASRVRGKLQTTINAPRFDCEFFPTATTLKRASRQLKRNSSVSLLSPRMAAAIKRSWPISCAFFKPADQGRQRFEAAGTTENSPSSTVTHREYDHFHCRRRVVNCARAHGLGPAGPGESDRDRWDTKTASRISGRR